MSRTRNHGEYGLWEFNDANHCECSLCGYVVTDAEAYKLKECPDCGAFMGEQEYTLRDDETVPVVTEQAEPKNKTCNDSENYDRQDNYCSYKKAVGFMEDVCYCEEFKPAHDAVSHPSHYCKGGVECLDAIKAALGDKYEGFLAGNVLKYVYRYPDKNGVEDCRKAAFYLDKLIKELENEK